MRYTTILWDLDHTLMDSDASLNGAIASTLALVGVVDVDATTQTFHRINHALWREVEAGDRSPNEVKTLRFSRLIDECGLNGGADEMAEAFAESLGQLGDLYPGAMELLVLARRRSERMALVTNGIGTIQRTRIARLGIDDLFDAHVISGEVGVAKPGPQIFDLTFEHLGAAKERSVMIGDNLSSDIRGAIDYGIESIWLNHSTSTAFEQAEDGYSPTHAVSSLAEIADLL